MDKGNKSKLLVQLLEEKHIPSALVFTRTKHGADRVAQEPGQGQNLRRRHPRQQEPERPPGRAWPSFKNGSIRVLVATDIAARGIDIEELACVFNYDLPDVPETYVHRIGRTGRAGKDGIAISFCDFGEKPLLRRTSKSSSASPSRWWRITPIPMQVFEAPVKDKHGRVVNPEDAEARKAAKARKAAGQKGQPGGEPLPGKPGKQEKQGKQERQTAKGDQEATRSGAQPAPTAEKSAPSDIKLPGQRTYKRPVRKPMSALDEIAPALPPEEMPQPKYGAKRTGHLRNTFFTPEEQKAYGGEPEPLMDATARLFASRKPIPERYQEPGYRAPGQEGQGRKKGKKSGQTSAAQGGQSGQSGKGAAAKAEQPAQGQNTSAQGAKKKKKKKKSSAAKPQPQNQGTPAAQARLLKPTKQKRRRHDRPPHAAALHLRRPQKGLHRAKGFADEALLPLRRLTVSGGRPCHSPPSVSPPVLSSDPSERLQRPPPGMTGDGRVPRRREARSEKASSRRGAGRGLSQGVSPWPGAVSGGGMPPILKEEHLPMRKKLPLFLAAAALVAVDQITKVLTRTLIPLGERITLIPGVVGLTYVQNTGAAFSSFTGGARLLSLLSLAMTVLLGVAIAKNWLKHPFAQWLHGGDYGRGLRQLH